jgi:hypothetical protein
MNAMKLYVAIIHVRIEYSFSHADQTRLINFTTQQEEIL